MNSIFSKKTKEESITYDTMSSLSHTKWNCKYHIGTLQAFYKKSTTLKALIILHCEEYLKNKR